MSKSRTVFLTDSQKKALSKEAALGIYIPKSMQYSAGKLPAVEDDYPDKHGMRYAEETVKAKISELYRDGIIRHFGDNTLEELLSHFRWTADRFGLDKSRLDNVSSAKELEETWADIFWSAMEPRLRNPALFEFFIDAIADRSVAFWTFLVAAPGGASIETAYGYMLDPVGIYRKVPDNDPLQVWRRGVNKECYDRGFGYQVCRDNLTAEIAVDLRPKRVAIFGGGWLPEWHFPETIKHHLSLFADTEFCVCDSDKKVDPALVMSNLPGAIATRMSYKIQDIASFLGELAAAQKPFDMAILKGVASFMTREQLLGFLITVFQLLRPGGKLVFDLQLSHFTMARNAVIFGWGDGSTSAKINLMTEPEAKEYAISCLNVASAKLWKNPAYWNTCNVRMESDITLDNLDGDPVGIIVTVERPITT